MIDSLFQGCPFNRLLLQTFVPGIIQTISSWKTFLVHLCQGTWSYGSWIYDYICNPCLSPVTLWVRILPRWGVLDTTLCYKVCQWLVTDQWFSLGTPIPSTNKTNHHDITELSLKMELNSKTPNLTLKTCLVMLTLIA